MGSDDGLDGPERGHSVEARAVEQLSGWLGKAIQEGWAVLNSPCPSTTQKDDLAEVFKRAAEECRFLGPIQVSFPVTGDSKEMRSVARNELYRVGSPEDKICRISSTAASETLMAASTLRRV